MSAAAIAARTSLVFIERYPKEEATVSETQSNKRACGDFQIARLDSIGSPQLLKP